VNFISEIYFRPVVSGDTVRRGERTTGASSFFESAGDESFASYETKVRFDRNGNISECFMDDSASNFHFKEVFEYDGYLLVCKQGFLSGKFFYKETYRYDSKNRATERNFYDSEKHLFESVITEYPDENTVVEKIHTENRYSDFERETKLKNGAPVLSTSRLDSEQIIEQWRGEYDAGGRINRSLFYDRQNNLLQYERYVYDESGNELEYAVFSDNDQLITKRKYHYKYDENGNWIQQVSIVDGLPQIIILRNIIYY
jgi:hypothetical protein